MSTELVKILHVQTRKPRSKTFNNKRLGKKELAHIRQETRAIEEDGDPLPRLPHTRQECLPGGSNEARPCPFVSCRWHLFLDVNRLGNMRLNHGDRNLEDLDETCSLDLADCGEHTLKEVGKAINIARERVRQIENMFLDKLYMNQDAQDAFDSFLEGM